MKKNHKPSDDEVKRLLEEIHDESLVSGIQATDYSNPNRGPVFGHSARKPSLDDMDSRSFPVRRQKS